MQVLVPFEPTRPKSRLAGTLSEDERVEFAHHMFRGVCECITATGRDPVILSTESLDCPHEVIVDTRPLTPAVNAFLESQSSPVAIIMADLALLTPSVLEEFCTTQGDVVIAQSRGGGTNAIVSRTADFTVDYHGTSFLDHVKIAESINATVTVFDSYRLGTDIDEPDDLAEVLLHGNKQSRQYLETKGFKLETTDGRVFASR